MTLSRYTGNWIVCASLFAAFLLMAIPLPYWANDWQPHWLAMIWIYWCVALPKKVGIASGWCLGLLLDIQYGALLGQNALVFAVLTYFMVGMYKRFRIFTLVQQSCYVGLMILLSLVFNSCVRGVIGIEHYTWSYWMQGISSTILWPWLFIILRDIRRRYRVT